VVWSAVRVSMSNVAVGNFDFVWAADGSGLAPATALGRISEKGLSAANDRVKHDSNKDSAQEIGKRCLKNYDYVSDVYMLQLPNTATPFF
jgi:hypothetical protein